MESHPPPSARHAADDGRGPGDGLVRVGAALFVLGLIAVVVAVGPFLLGSSNDPGVAASAAAALLPSGLGLALLGLVRGARTRRRAARQD